ncbi:hypothetical protein DVV91_10620 [Clostridium botulinum]|uniref:hypothetical protein n=1 Tax=Clostridium botulinum TaxID=1491 RepID=UPI000A7FC73C|nr:hypothetical protein [Clostridium botulinum]MBN1074794.1 hypothetical protein [Clostridium botulinum]NFL87396.1 hypothetical protein [Clostridium botulinum]NFO21733.1 hypothetical protein [Clostridium botulinum]
MIVTNINPCIKVTKENNMSGMDIYIELGERVRITDNKGNIFIGKLSFVELAKYEEEDDIIYLLLDNEKQINIGTSYIEDIDIL